MVPKFTAVERDSFLS